nr:hypothetical protein [Acidibrevibacterium fodinaquatile]
MHQDRIAQFALNRRHVTSGAGAARAIGAMMRVGRNGLRVGTILGICTVAGKAQIIALGAHHCRIVAAVRIMTGKARHAAPVHQALDKIVALHAVFMRRAIGEKIKIGDAGMAPF